MHYSFTWKERGVRFCLVKHAFLSKIEYVSVLFETHRPVFVNMLGWVKINQKTQSQTTEFVQKPLVLRLTSQNALMLMPQPAKGKLLDT